MTQLKIMGKIFLPFLALVVISGCGSKGGMGGMLTSSDVLIVQHHVRQHYHCLEEFCRRLYLKNPKYEPNAEKQAQKLDIIFKKRKNLGSPYDNQASHEVLTAAFSADSEYDDRIALLALGLCKSIDEGYEQSGPDDDTMITSLQISLDRLKKLYSNISHVNWRLKVYRDTDQKLYFLTNEIAPEGHLNMGYEVLMTKILTRIEDDIYLRGGNPPNVIFRMSTMFFSLFI